MSLAVQVAALAEDPAPLPISPVGVWTLEKDPTTRIEFDRKNLFRFDMPSYKSSSTGRFEVQGNQIILFYSSVDGEPAPTGMKMVIKLTDDESFKINKFRYVRSRG